MGILNKLQFWKKEDSFAELNKQLDTLKQQSPQQAPEGFGTPDPLVHSMDTGIPYEHPAEEKPFSDVGYSLEPAEEKTMFARPQQPLYTPAEQPNSSLHAQMEIIAAKLDTIRVSLESINHRLVAVERALHVQEYEEPIQPRKRRGNW